MILSAMAAKPNRRSKDDFKGWHFEASPTVQAVSMPRIPSSGGAIRPIGQFHPPGMPDKHCQRPVCFRAYSAQFRPRRYI